MKKKQAFHKLAVLSLIAVMMFSVVASSCADAPGGGVNSSIPIAEIDPGFGGGFGTEGAQGITPVTPEFPGLGGFDYPLDDGTPRAGIAPLASGVGGPGLDMLLRGYDMFGGKAFSRPNLNFLVTQKGEEDLNALAYSDNLFRWNGGSSASYKFAAAQRIESLATANGIDLKQTSYENGGISGNVGVGAFFKASASYKWTLNSHNSSNSQNSYKNSSDTFFSLTEVKRELGRNAIVDVNSLRYYNDVIWNSMSQEVRNTLIGVGGRSAEMLFSNYGTHVITSYNMGGRVEQYTSIVKTSSESDESLMTEMGYNRTTATTANASGGYGIVSASVDFNRETEETKNVLTNASRLENKDGYEVDKVSQVFGGNKDLGKVLDPNSTVSDFSGWLNSIDPTNPEDTTDILIDDMLGVVGIWELLPQGYAARKAELQKAFLDKLRLLDKFFYEEYVYNVTAAEQELQGPLPTMPEPVYDSTYTEIRTAQDLYDIRTNKTVNGKQTGGLAGKYMLCNDIDVSQAYPTWTPIGNSAAAPFTGEFEGMGNKITGIHVSAVLSTPGLFAYNSGKIRNLSAEYSSRFGGIAGRNNDAGVITNCHANFVPKTPNKTYTGLTQLRQDGGNIPSTNAATVLIDLSAVANPTSANLTVTVPTQTETVIFKGAGQMINDLSIKVTGAAYVVFDNFKYTGQSGVRAIENSYNNLNIISIGGNNEIYAHPDSAFPTVEGDNVYIHGNRNLKITGAKGKNPGDKGQDAIKGKGVYVALSAELIATGGDGRQGMRGADGGEKNTPYFYDVVGNPGGDGGKGGDGGNAVKANGLGIYNHSVVKLIGGYGGPGGAGGNGGEGLKDRGGAGGNGGKGGTGGKGGSPAVVDGFAGQVGLISRSAYAGIYVTNGRGGYGGGGGIGGNGSYGSASGNGGSGGRGGVGGNAGYDGSLAAFKQFSQSVPDDNVYGGTGGWGGFGGAGGAPGSSNWQPGTSYTNVRADSGIGLPWAPHNETDSGYQYEFPGQTVSGQTDNDSRLWTGWRFTVTATGKTEYFQSTGIFEPAGYSFSITHSGVTEAVPASAVNFTYDFSVTGMRTVKADYWKDGDQLTAFIPVTVVAPVATDISVFRSDKTAFYVGDTFNLDGCCVVLNYSDGSYDLLPFNDANGSNGYNSHSFIGIAVGSSIVFSKASGSYVFTENDIGTHNIGVMALASWPGRGITLHDMAAFTITVAAAKPLSVQYTGTPATQIQGNAFNPTGLSFSVLFEGGSSQTVNASQLVFNPGVMNDAGAQTVTVRYGTDAVGFIPVSVARDNIDRLVNDSPVSVTDYFVDQFFRTEDLVVYGIRESGRITPIAGSEFEVQIITNAQGDAVPNRLLRASDLGVKLLYHYIGKDNVTGEDVVRSASLTMDIAVRPDTPQELSVKASKGKLTENKKSGGDTVFTEGQAFVINNEVEVWMITSSGISRNVTAECTLLKSGPLSPEDRFVTIVWKDKPVEPTVTLTKEFPITVVPRVNAPTPVIEKYSGDQYVLAGEVANYSFIVYAGIPEETLEDFYKNVNQSGGRNNKFDLTYKWYQCTSPTGVGAVQINNAFDSVLSGNLYSPTPGIFYYYAEVTCTIPNNGDGGVKTVTVKSPVMSLIFYIEVGVTATNVDGRPDIDNTTSIALAFSSGGKPIEVTGLTAAAISLSGISGAATKGSLTGSAQSGWNLGVNVSKQGTVAVSVADFGIYRFVSVPSFFACMENADYDVSLDEKYKTDGVSIDNYKGNDYLIEVPAALGLGNVLAIGDYAFAGSVNARVIILPEGLKAIGEGAFYACPNLRYIYIPASVTFIHENAFSDSKLNSFLIITTPGSYAAGYAGQLFGKSKRLILVQDRYSWPEFPVSAAPSASYASGAVPAGTGVMLSSPERLTRLSETAIYYTLDGSEPTENSARYNDGYIWVNESVTLKAKAFTTGRMPSETVTYYYEVNNDLPLIRVSDALGWDNSVITLTVTVDNIPGISVYGITMMYDPSVYTFIEAKKGDILPGLFNANHVGNLVYFSSYNFFGEFETGSVLFTITLRVKTGTPAGIADFGAISFFYSNPAIDGFTVCEENSLTPYTTYPMVKLPVITIVTVLTGDVNGDGKVDQSDMVLLNQFISQRVGADGILLYNADIDGTGEIDANDRTLMIKFFVERWGDLMPFADYVVMVRAFYADFRELFDEFEDYADIVKGFYKEYYDEKTGESLVPFDAYVTAMKHYFTDEEGWESKGISFKEYAGGALGFYNLAGAEDWEMPFDEFLALASGYFFAAGGKDNIYTHMLEFGEEEPFRAYLVLVWIYVDNDVDMSFIEFTMTLSGAYVEFIKDETIAVMIAEGFFDGELSFGRYVSLVTQYLDLVADEGYEHFSSLLNCYLKYYKTGAWMEMSFLAFLAEFWPYF